MFEWKKVASNAVFLDENTGGKGKYFRARILQAGLVKYSFGVCLLENETINKFIYEFVGCPVIIDHKDITNENAKDERVGVISRVWFDQMDGWFWVEGVIFDEEAINLINDGYNVSCQYEISEYANNVGNALHNGNPYDKVILNGKPEHLAIVKNPRYENAMIAVNALDATNKDDEDIEWITVKGNHIPVKKGQSKEEAVKQFIADKEEKEKKNWKSYDEMISQTEKQLEYVKYKLKQEDNAKYKHSPEKRESLVAGIYELEDRLKYYKEQAKKEKSSDENGNDFNKGDKVKADTNWRGVNPKEITGEIVDKRKIIAGHGDTNPNYEYLIKTEDGKTTWVNEEGITSSKKEKSPDGIEGKINQYIDKIPKAYMRDNQTKALWLYKNSYITRSEWEDYRNKAKNTIIEAINEIKETDMFSKLFKKKENKMDKDELKSLFMECLSELTAKNEADAKKEDEKLADDKVADNAEDNQQEDDKKDDKKDDKADNKCKNEVVDKRDIIRQIMAIAGKEEASEDVKTIAKLAEKLAYDKSEADDKKADNKCKNEDVKDADKPEDEKEKASNAIDEIIGKMSAGTNDWKPSSSYMTQKKAVELGDKLF